MTFRFVSTGIVAIAAVVLAGCAHTPQGRGALGGGAVGAATGAVIGAATGGSAGTGALIGAGVGTVTGAIAGDIVDEDRRRRYHRGPVYVYRPAPPPPPVVVRRPAHFSRSYRLEAAPPRSGHYETRLVRGRSGEYYEERVWIPDR